MDDWQWPHHPFLYFSQCKSIRIVLFSWKKRIKTSSDCTFFLAWPRKNQRDQDRIRTFGLTQKYQKVKAHTAEATVSVAALKSRKTRLRLKQPRFFDAPLGRPLHASSVRPKQWAIIQAKGPSPSPIENGKLRIDNSFGTDFSDFTEIIILHFPFSIEDWPHRPSGTSPTTGEVFGSY